MALTFEELDSTAINEIGAELASARDLLNKTSSDFVLDLRTTRHHVNAIESGDLRIFYGAPFYIDLMRRYAKALNFSENKILEFEKRVLGFTEDKSDSLPSKNDKECLSVNSSLNHGSSGESRKKVFSNVKIKRKKLSIDSDESKLLKEKIDRLLLFLLALIVLVSGLVFILPKGQLTVDSEATYEQQLLKTPRDTTDKITTSNSSKKNKINQNTFVAKKNIENFEPTKLLNYDQVNNPKIKEKIISEGDLGETTKQVNYVKESTEEITRAEEKSDEKAPTVSLYANEKTWYWIRYADDSVREFMVDADSITNILKYPIYLVIGKPEVVEMSINGSDVYIERNDPDRNLARYTRTELREMSK